MELALGELRRASSPPRRPRRRARSACTGPTLVPADAVEHAVVLPDGAACAIEPAPRTVTEPSVPTAAPDTAPRDAGTVGARPGASAGDDLRRAVGGQRWQRERRAVDPHRRRVRVAARLPHRRPVPRAACPRPRPRDRPLRAGQPARGQLRGGRAFSARVSPPSTRHDPQAKGLGEYVRARLVDIPVA